MDRQTYIQFQKSMSCKGIPFPTIPPTLKTWFFRYCVAADFRKKRTNGQTNSHTCSKINSVQRQPTPYHTSIFEVNRVYGNLDTTRQLILEKTDERTDKKLTGAKINSVQRHPIPYYCSKFEVNQIHSS